MHMFKNKELVQLQLSQIKLSSAHVKKAQSTSYTDNRSWAHHGAQQANFLRKLSL